MGRHNALKMRREKSLEGSNPSTPTNLIPYSKLTEIAANSTHPKHKHAALVFHNGELVGYANNLGNYHAEVRALQVAKMYGYKTDLTVLSIRISKSGKLKLAKPCDSCMTYMRKRGIACILYSTDDGTIVRL